ncbi:MAG: HlyC/CorC family transporter [Deltaproteobacteria bacterium]|nr:HlyC/CorC family transporter [Deltaproteobacteria bacterium]
MLSTEWHLPLTFVLLLANAFFVAAEFAIVKVRGAKIDDLARRGSPLANVARKIIHNLDASLAAAQLGITFASLGLGWIGEPTVARLLQPVFALVGIGSPEAVHGVSFAVAFLVITALHIVIGEQMPKFLGIRKPQEVALWTSLPFLLFSWFFTPVLWMLNVCANAVLRLFGVHDVKVEDLSHSEEELRTILSESQRHGALSADRVNLLENVLDMAGRTVMEIMSPRPDVDYLSLGSSWKDNLDTIYRTGHTRYPLCETDIDQVIGMVHIKDIFLQRIEIRTSSDLLKIKRDVLFIPESRPVESLQQDFQQRRLHMAVVIDEYGSTSGLVTMEDVLEELVGEIQDEFDSERPKLEHTAEGAMADGHTPLSEVTDALGLEHMEVKDTHTIGGYINSQLGRIGRIGDTVELDGNLVTVLEMNGRRIMRVLIAPLPLATSQPQTAASDG